MMTGPARHPRHTNGMENVHTQQQDRVGYLRLKHWIVCWVLVSFVIGVAVGYCLFLARDYDVAERYRQHLMQYHSGRHQSV